MGNGKKDRKDDIDKKRAGKNQDLVIDGLTANDPGWYKQLSRQWYQFEKKHYSFEVRRNVDFRIRPNKFEMSMGHTDGGLGYGSGTQERLLSWRQKPGESSA